MSLAFLLLAGYILLSLSNIIDVLLDVVNVFRYFNTSMLIGYLMNVAIVLIPVALLVLLILDGKKEMKEVAWIVLVAGGILKLFSLLKMVIPTLMNGGVDLIGMLPLFARWIITAIAGVLMIIGALNIKDGKNRKLIPIAVLGGFLFLFFGTIGVLSGSMPLLTMLRELLLLIALCVLPGTFTNYETCVKANGAGLKIVAVVLAAVFFVMVVASMANDSGSSQYGDGVNTCRICGRRTSLVAGFGMCGECYYDFNDWLDGD